MKTDSKTIARYALIVALIIVAYSIDSFLVSRLLPIRIAVATLLTVLTIVQLFDLKTAVFTTTVFGLMSFLYAYIFPNFVSQVFINPLVSVLPRVFIGLVSFSVLKLSNKLTKDTQNIFVKKYLTSSIAAACGVLTNTGLVMSMISILDNQNIIKSIINVVLGVNFPAEFASCLLVVPILVNSVKGKIRI